MDLESYMSESIEQLIKEVLKHSFENPKESAFILKYMFAQKNAEKKRHGYEERGVHIPPFLIASITSECNLNCAGCYAMANMPLLEERGRNELSCTEWENVFKEASDMGVSFILLAGGEPLMRKDVLEKAACFPDIIFPVFTNGTMIDESYVELFNKNRNLIPIFSIEGEEVQTDERRGQGTYETLMRAMDRMNAKKVFFGVSVTVTVQNLYNVTNNDFIGDLQRKRCGIVFYVEYVPAVASTGSLALTESERNILETKIEDLRKLFKNITFISFPGDEKEMKGCLAAGRGFFHINAIGNAEPCPFSPYSDTNIRHSSLTEALNSQLFQDLRNGGLLEGDHSGGCVLFYKQNEVKKLIEMPIKPEN